MKNSKSIKNSNYINFSIIYFIVSFSSLLVIKHQTNNILYIYPNSIDYIKNINFISFVFIFLVFIITLLFIRVIRKEIVEFSDNIIYNIDEFISGNKNLKFELNKDNLISKVQNKIKYMVEVMENKNSKYLEEKDSIKTLISDISHQIKTPIANISMYNETLINRELD
ncbi:MAG: hypothetical protein ACRC3Y_18790, partial [Romboutsia sp.]